MGNIQDGRGPLCLKVLLHSKYWSDFAFSCANSHLSIAYTCNVTSSTLSAFFMCHIFSSAGMRNHEHWRTDWGLFFPVFFVHLFLFLRKLPPIRNYIYICNSKAKTHTSLHQLTISFTSVCMYSYMNGSHLLMPLCW